MVAALSAGFVIICEVACFTKSNFNDGKWDRKRPAIEYLVFSPARRKMLHGFKSGVLFLRAVDPCSSLQF
jgi:hypothetical protein